MQKTRLKLPLIFTLLGVLLVASPAFACGGLFCTTIPVSQSAERIIFTENADDSTSAIIQINYSGNPDEFSWILPVKTPLNVEDDIELPEDAEAAFTELDTMTLPQYIAPDITDECWQVMPVALASEAEDGSGGGVEIISQGFKGNYEISVVDSSDQNALIDWLNVNGYTVTPEMEPLINIYVDEDFYFLAMKLIPDSDVSDVVPLKMTYPAPIPMIPLRMTPVGADMNMQVVAWFFGSAQATPTNYTRIVVEDEDVNFFFPFGHNYWQVMQDQVDAENGLAFVTEYAQPTGTMAFTHPLLAQLDSDYAYLTRLNTFMDPEQMTVDPMFEYDETLAPINNIHDLSETHKWVCNGETFEADVVPVGTAGSNSPLSTTNTEQTVSATNWVLVTVMCTLLGMLLLGYWVVRHND